MGGTAEAAGKGGSEEATCSVAEREGRVALCVWPGRVGHLFFACDGTGCAAVAAVQLTPAARTACAPVAATLHAPRSTSTALTPISTHTRTHLLPATLPAGYLCASDSPPRRTFLSWLHFAVVLGGLAVGLLNFGSDHKAGLISAALYTIIGELNHITGGRGGLQSRVSRRHAAALHTSPRFTLHDRIILLRTICMFAANTASHGSHDIRPGNLSNARAVNQTADGRAVR